MLSRVYKYGNSYKVVCFKCGNLENVLDGESKCFTPNSEKLKNNISRARSRVLEIAPCNEWEYFLTPTLDGNKQNRTGLAGWYIRDLDNWIENYN